MADHSTPAVGSVNPSGDALKTSVGGGGDIGSAPSFLRQRFALFTRQSSIEASHANGETHFALARLKGAA